MTLPENEPLVPIVLPGTHAYTEKSVAADDLTNACNATTFKM